MQQQAEAVGANAILNVRFSTSSVAQGGRDLCLRHRGGPGIGHVRSAPAAGPAGPGCGFGQVAERRHYRSIVEREARLNRTAGHRVAPSAH